MPTTVEKLFQVPLQDLPRVLAPLPSLLRKAQSKSCQNVTGTLAHAMVPAESRKAGRVHTYNLLKNGVLSRAKSVDDSTHSVVLQIISVLEQQSFEEPGLTAVLGALTAKIEDFGFLTAFRDQFPRP